MYEVEYLELKLKDKKLMH